MRPWPVLLLALLLAGCAGERGERAPDRTSEQPVRLEPDSFFLGTFDLDGPSRVRVTVNVTEGGEIDAWLAFGAACGEWLRSSFQPTDTDFGTRHAVLEATLPAGSACVPIDNSDIPPGTANSGAEVVASYRVDVWRR